MDADPDSETEAQWENITLPPGIEWSGRARYGAAMYFYACGEMDVQTLEVYRYLARLDAEEPADVLRRYRVGDSWLEKLARRSR
ncbi:hypothetical protein [Rhizobium sp. SL42]|uniref:hypothetical protein n=1 Tax=Rhizobium sp. SL42 TaxID=2806346 RepID=UPI001F411E88|nr:hypothetical protein [Rhizobium sp. SL42]UJW77116.1 hypothetical protein IM739_21790 [Rhizobium sp. SL42]